MIDPTVSSPAAHILWRMTNGYVNTKAAFIVIRWCNASKKLLMLLPSSLLVTVFRTIIYVKSSPYLNHTLQHSQPLTLKSIFIFHFTRSTQSDTRSLLKFNVLVCEANCSASNEL